MLQKSQNAVRLNFRQTPNQAATVDRCSLKRAREVASELITERSGPHINVRSPRVLSGKSGIGATPESGLKLVIAACSFRADIVAKVEN